MSAWFSYFTGKRAPPSKDATRDAIIDLRSTLLTLNKQEEFLNKKIEEEVSKAKAALAQGGANGKRVATNAVAQKKRHEAQLDKIAGTRTNLEAQVSDDSIRLSAEEPNELSVLPEHPLIASQHSFRIDANTRISHLAERH